MMINKTPVSIVSGKDPENMVKNALNYIGGLDKFVSGDEAFIKPNLGSWITTGVPNYVNRWATTKPEIIVGIIKELNKIGINHITVGDGSFLDQDMTVQLEDSGMKEKVEDAGGKVIDLDRSGHERVEVSDDLTLEIAEPVLSTNNLINVPVMKTHIQTKLTLGIKNLKGVVSKSSKRAMHRGDLEKYLALLCKTIRPKLTIVDGLVGMEGLGPAVFGKPKNPGLIVAGIDPVAVDTVTAKIMGHDPKKIEHITLSNELGIGISEMEEINLFGEPIGKSIHPFEPAQLGVKNIIKQLDIDEIRYFGTEGAAESECTGCINTLLNTLLALKSDVGSLETPLDIIIGTRVLPEDIGTNALFYGNCQAKKQKPGGMVIWLPTKVKRNLFNHCEDDAPHNRIFTRTDQTPFQRRKNRSFASLDTIRTRNFSINVDTF